MTTVPGADSYIVRMGLAFSAQDGNVTGRLPHSPGLCASDGRVRLGALAALSDCLVGYRAVDDFAGAWIGTSELAIFGPSGLAPAGVEATADLLRRRRRGAVYQVGARAGTDTLAVATVTLGLLSRQGEPKVPATVTGPTAGEPGPLGSLSDLLALELVPGGGGTALPLGAGVRNSWGVVAGGIIALLAESEAERAAGCLLDVPCAVEGLVLHFLAPGRAGPLEARAERLGPAGNPVHLQVRVVDAGADRLVATAGAVVVPVL